MNNNPSKNSFICKHFKECAGCSHYLTFEPPSIWQEVLGFFSPLVPILHQGSPIHWRYRAKLAVRGTIDQPLIGLFKRSSHQVMAIPDCLVHHPHLNQAVEIIKQWMIEEKIKPYDEKTGQGELRYLQGVVQRESGRVQLTLVVNFKPTHDQAKRWQGLVYQLGEKYPSFWHSLWLNFNDQSTNTIFGEEWQYVGGEELLWENFEEVKVCYGPASFSQANLPLFEQMLKRIRTFIPPQAKVVEFYAGAGVIGLFVASHCKQVHCIEINPHAEYYFNQSHAKLDQAIAQHLKFFTVSTEKALDHLQEATTLIVDPPRKGLPSSFFKALEVASTIEQLIYISCGWESFKRDCRLLYADQWEIQDIEGYLFFPGSDHIELLAHFIRKKL